MKYRADVDGLRAVAVGPVILFHAGFGSFAGGFVGVDVFFVISGFLITGLILDDIDRGKFSIIEFYERRARRILPALFVVTAASAIFAWRWMSPSDLQDFAASALYLSFFASNFYFLGQSGYFDPASESRPLLHTWSLGIEEQFYLVFPILLLVLLRTGLVRRFGLVAPLLALAAVSLGLSQATLESNPASSFYLLHTRAWELLSGALCTIWLRSGSGPRANDGFAAIGLALIVIAIAFFDENTSFPGFYAVLPVAGAALVILFTGDATRIGRFLGSPLLRGIGLLSYSAYLWHQPLFAFARIRTGGEPSHIAMLGLSVVAFALAYLTWRLVETPIRLRGSREVVSRAAVFSASIAGLIGMLSASAYAVHKEGLPNRTAPSGLSFVTLSGSRTAPNFGLDESCTQLSEDAQRCRTAPNPQILLWGDSFAMHLAGALKASRSNVPFVQITMSQCAPLYGIAFAGRRLAAEECIEFNDQVISWLRKQEGVEYVVLSTPFTILRRPVFDRNGAEYQAGESSVVMASLAETARLIREAGKWPVVVSPTPTNGQDLGKCLIHAGTFGLPPDACDFPISEISGSTRDALDFLSDAASVVPVLDLSVLMCPDRVCRTVLDGTFVYRDWGHLSREGSEALGRRMDITGRLIETAKGHFPCGNTRAGAEIPTEGCF